MNALACTRVRRSFANRRTPSHRSHHANAIQASIRCKRFARGGKLKPQLLLAEVTYGRSCGWVDLGQIVDHLSEYMSHCKSTWKRALLALYMPQGLQLGFKSSLVCCIFSNSRDRNLSFQPYLRCRTFRLTKSVTVSGLAYLGVSGPQLLRSECTHRYSVIHTVLAAPQINAACNCHDRYAHSSSNTRLAFSVCQEKSFLQSSLTS